MKKNFQDIIEQARGRRELANRQTENGVPFTKATIVHIYGHLELTNALGAAQSDAERRRALSVLQAFTTVSERAGKEFSIVLAEMQGERVHMIFETDNPQTARDTVINFARVWNAGINAVVKPKARDDFQSFYMAADLGPTMVLLSTGSDASESIICLGNAANRPAKLLGRWTGDKNGHIRLNAAAFRGDGEDRPATWEDHDVSVPPSLAQQPESARMLNRITEAIDPVIAGYVELSAKDLVPVVDAPVTAPERKRGFCLRADLDGFSARVQAVMRGSDQMQQALVDEFDHVMKEYPEAFAREIKGTVTVFPWAGDCANFIIEPESNIGYEAARTFMPASAAHAWHKISRQPRHRRWSSEPHRWAVGILGGDGYMLVARVHTTYRSFAVASGWPWGRSLDAYQADHVLADDTVISKEDYSELDERYSEPFSQLDSRFYRATLNALERALHEIRNEPARSQPQPFHIGVVAESLPRQRPYGGLE